MLPACGAEAAADSSAVLPEEFQRLNSDLNRLTRQLESNDPMDVPLLITRTIPLQRFRDAADAAAKTALGSVDGMDSQELAYKADKTITKIKTDLGLLMKKAEKVRGDVVVGPQRLASLRDPLLRIEYDIRTLEGVYVPNGIANPALRKPIFSICESGFLVCE